MSAQNRKMTRSTKRSLKTLQSSATDKQNLVGRPSKSLKQQLSQENISDTVEVKRKNLCDKETQVNIDLTITADDLTNPDGPSEKYWKILSEKRQTTLQEVLEENEKLRKIIKDLKEENALFKQMLEEANSFVEVIKEELACNSNNDTGIDVNDVSTADEANEEVNEATSNDNKN